MANDKLNMKEILYFKKPWWRQIAERIKKWIWRDMRKGKVQDYTKTFAYQYTKQYHDYKTTGMKRKSDGKRLGSPRKLKSGETRTYKNNSLVGKSTNKSGTPNMLLTGETIKGLHYISNSPKNMKMGYMDKDAGKIKGNLELGRWITTLNNSNMNLLAKQFEKQINYNIKVWASKKVNLYTTK